MAPVPNDCGWFVLLPGDRVVGDAYYLPLAAPALPAIPLGDLVSTLFADFNLVGDLIV